MEYRISLSPDGLLRLHVNDTRFLELTADAAGAALLKRMLKDANEDIVRPGYIGRFPTQATIDSFQKKIDWLHREPAVVRTILEDTLVPKKATHSKPSRRAFKAEKKKAEAKSIAGIDLGGLEFTL